MHASSSVQGIIERFSPGTSWQSVQPIGPSPVLITKARPRAQSWRQRARWRGHGPPPRHRGRGGCWSGAGRELGSAVASAAALGFGTVAMSAAGVCACGVQAQLERITPLWLKLSLALKKDPVADKRFGLSLIHI